ncbi:MAG: adenosine deaminase [Acidimicrobiia bacterium]|nr:adenosine deaminase [Acidimicrobiia bacterium]
MVSDERLAALPKVELHLHLEGSLRPRTVLALAERNGVDIGCSTEEELTARYRFDDFLHFIALFRAGLSVLHTPDDYVAVADALTDELAAQQVRHAEITTTPFHPLRRLGFSVADYAGALDEAQRHAAEKDVSIVWIPDISRGDELPDDMLTTGLLDGPHCPVGAVALGIGGPEAEWPAELFADAFARARAAGFPAVVHAGEAAGPESVRAALDVLHASRIGHGVRAMEDPALVARLAEEQIPIEVSPTSNVLLIPHVAPSIEAHPIGAMVAAGLNVSVNTDDPGLFSSDLSRELRLVSEHHDFDEAALAAAQARAIDASYASDALKARVHTEIDAWLEGGNSGPS